MNEDTKAQQWANYPPLPEVTEIDRHLPTNYVIRGYTLDQMRAYGAACVAADREGRPPEYSLGQTVKLYTSTQAPACCPDCGKPSGAPGDVHTCSPQAPAEHDAYVHHEGRHVHVTARWTRVSDPMALPHGTKLYARTPRAKDMKATMILYEHTDGRMRVAPEGRAHFTRSDPAWHRVGPVDVDVDTSHHPNTTNQKIVSRWDSDRVLFERELPDGLDSIKD